MPPSAAVPPTAPTPTAPPAPLSPIESIRDPEQPFSATTGDISPQVSGVDSVWTLQPIPDGSDLPDQLPRLPQGWQNSTATLFANASCSSGVVAPGTTVEVTLWPNIEEDGHISDFNPWQGGENLGNSAVVACLESLAPRMTPLIPARTGGEPIASYAILITVTVRGTQ